MKRILLILPSSTYRSHDFMVAAQRVNVEVVVASDHRQALASLVPDTTLNLNFRDLDSIRKRVLEFAAKKPFAAILGVDDTSAYIAAVAADALGIIHNPLSAVAAARNKFLMRQKIAAAGLPAPNFRLFSLKKKAARLAEKISYPCVLKPTFLSASRGVTRVNTPVEFVAAFEDIRRLLSNPEVKARAYDAEADQVLAEDYIPGVEVAVEGILLDGELKTLAIFDKPDPLEGPHFVETIYVTPSRLPGYVLREISHAAAQAARALGLKSGPIHAEVRINEDNAYVVEIAARSIGGWCSRVLKFQEGVTLEELILRQAVGEDVRHYQRESTAAGVMMVPVPRAGILKEIRGIEAARKQDGVVDVFITIPTNQHVLPMPQGGKYLGFIFARGEAPEEAEEALRNAYHQLEINVE